MMDRGAGYVLAGLVAVGAALIALSPRTPLAAKAQAVSGGWQGTTWSPTQPAQPYQCRGGLYHPPLAGQGRTALIAHGWAWITNPPSEQTGPGVSDG